MSKKPKPFERPQAVELTQRLVERRRFIQVVAGPRQVGKTTLVQQVMEAIDLPSRYASADEPTLRGADWIAQQWQVARLEAKEALAARCWYWTKLKKLRAGRKRLSDYGMKIPGRGER